MKINKKRLLRIFGYTLLIIGVSMLPSLVVAFANNKQLMIRSFLLPITFLISLGGLILRFTKVKQGYIKIRDCYMAVFMVIVTSCISGAFPFYIGIENSTFIQAIFESTAGLSTTSATVFYEPSMEESLILWKAIEHWIGGVILLIFIISILPILGIGDEQIATVEGHGRHLNKVAPRSKEILKLILITYLSITTLSFLYFILGDIRIFDSIILALSTSSTAGILLHPEGVSYYNSFYIEFGVAFLSILSSISFVIYINILKKNFIEIKKNIELRVFFIIIFTTTIIIALLLYLQGHGTPLTSLKDSFFQVSSFATTSGFALQNYMLWPKVCIFILVCLMIIGGCSASTTGSFKIIRLLIIIKLISRGFVRRIHPRSVKAVRVGTSVINVKMASSVTVFALMYFATILFSTIILSLQNLDLETTISAALGTISNSGISIGDIGMSGTYSAFHPLLQLFLSFLMVVGRVGIVTIAIVFLPSFWNPHKFNDIRI